MSTRHSFLSTASLVRQPSMAGSFAYSIRHASPGSTKPGKQIQSEVKEPADTGKRKVIRPVRAGVVPLGPAFLVAIAVVFSLFFVASISFAFVGSEDEPFFKDALDLAAQDDPGIVLVGENVDVDVDEPAITIRWSMVGCGPGYVLPGSEGSHGSMSCGLPAMALNIFVDGQESPTATFDPALIPIVNATGKRRNIQNLYQFDSEHDLDVHEARLYPFDTYVLTSTLRATAASDNNAPIPIRRLTTIDVTSSFRIASTDVSGYVNTSDGNAVQAPSREIDLHVSRPGEARTFALVLFGVSWMLAHATVALVAMSWNVQETEPLFKRLLFALIILLVIPQLRNAMPDAPGFDGVLIDSIGFFPQMLVSGICAIVLMCMIAKRELKAIEDSAPAEEMKKELPAPIAQGLQRLRRTGSSLDLNRMRTWRLSKAMNAPPSPIVERRESGYSDWT